MELSSEDPSCRQYRWPCAPGSDKSHAGISNHRLGETQRQHEMSARRLHGLRDRGRDAGHRTLSALPVDEGNDRRPGEEQEAPSSLHALRRGRRSLSEKRCRRARIRPVFVGGPHADQTNIKVRHEPRKQPATAGRLGLYYLKNFLVGSTFSGRRPFPPIMPEGLTTVGSLIPALNTGCASTTTRRMSTLLVRLRRRFSARSYRGPLRG